MIVLREIIETDNGAIAKIIRKSLLDFNAAKPGTVYYDPTTDNLHQLFLTKKSSYFIALYHNEIVGGAGIFPTANLPADTCELVKLYLTANVRGKGFGKLLMQQCMAKAITLGFKKMYLETMPELNIAIPLYEKVGFTYLPTALGNSGHTGCNVWMIKEL